MRKFLWLASVFAMPALAAELPVTAVVMSSGGLVQIERRASLGPEEGASFRVPLGDVDDLLKSLVVLDPAGSVASVRLPARDLAEEAFRGLPLKPEDFESRASLLNALRGQMATAGGATGRIAEAAETEKGLRLALVTPTGITSVLLGEGSEAVLADAALAARVARAAEALATARSDAERQVQVALRGTATREVSLLTVTPAPVWKPSWRLSVPAVGAATQAQARLQGWAVVENLSGADWDKVALTLVSGEAASLHQPLYDPIRVPRTELPLRVAEAVRVEADTGPAPPPPAPAPAAAPMLRMERARPQAAMAAPATPALAAASAGRIAFRLPEPVSVRSGETANLPFLDRQLPAERVWWIQDFASRNPLQAVSVTNAGDATLPDGIVTVFGTEGAEAGNWLGDAEMRSLPPGGTRLIAFGRDRDVQVTPGGDSQRRPIGAELRPAAVVLKMLRTEEMSLAIDPHGARGTLLIDLPRRPGATPKFPVSAEGEFGLRHRAQLDGQPTTLRLAFEAQEDQAVALWDPGLGDPIRLLWRDQDNLEPLLRRLPGGSGSLETLRKHLADMPASAPGRADLARIVDGLGEARRSLDGFRAELVNYRNAEAALARARQAAEDRTGTARDQARQALNAASLAAEQAGTRADASWAAWQRAAGAVLRLGG
jgi:hypothetical protein